MTGKGREPVGGLAMRARPGLFGYLAVLVAPIVVAAETFDVGLAASGARLDGQFVAADNSRATGA
jgi:hypothetical protein